MKRSLCGILLCVGVGVAAGPALSAPAAELLAKAGEGRPDFSAWAAEYLDDMKATVPIPGRRA